MPARHSNAGWFKKKHGLSHSITYVSWEAMIQRCYNPKHRSFHNYGARGIQVCWRWRESFEAFVADMGERPSLKYSLDRFPDKSGHYEPGNCRWATMKEQRRNARSNMLLTFRGETRTAVEWSELLGLPPNLLYQRLGRGWTVERALATPKQK